MTLGVLTSCGGSKEAVEIYINVPVLTVDCVSNPECESSADFIKIMWDSFAAQYDKYDVSLRGDQVYSFEQTEYAANITDVYGTEDCPDMSFGGYFAMSGYMYDGHMVPLDDIITDDIRADFSDATWKLSQGSNGKTYLMLMTIMTEEEYAADIVMMDIQMPVMNGYEATQALRELPGGEDMIIIAVSANAFAEDRQKSREAGMNEHISKPINISELMKTMRKYI